MKYRQLGGLQTRVDCPIFFGDERFNFQFAFGDQAKSDGLHAAGGESAANFFPEDWRNLVAHDAVQHAAGLLRVHQIFIYLAGHIERGANRFRE